MNAASYADEFRRAHTLIEGAECIAIAGHTSPDGDALGSALGLMHAIEGAYPEKRVDVLLADNAPIPRVYRFLPGSERFVPASSYEHDPDLFITVDAPTPARIRRAAAVLERSRASLVIDHHPACSESADVVVRNVDAAATAVLIERLVEALGFPLSKDVANCLFCGLVTDTGRFQYQNADPEAFSCAAKLVSAGADPARVSLEVYQSKRLGYLHLESIVCGRIDTIADGRIAYSYAYASDLVTCGVHVSECDGLVDLVRSVDGADVCVFLREDDNGTVRGNLRAKGELDVSRVAEALGGGGHVAAAGFTFDGDVCHALQVVMPMLEELVGRG